MNEKPLLFFPRPVPGTKSSRRAGPSTLSLPTAEQQHERLEARFQQIIDSFLTAQETIDGEEPEMVVVFVTAGEEVAELAKAAREVNGLEWLTEIESDEFEPAHGFQDTERPEEALTLPSLRGNEQSLRTGTPPPTLERMARKPSAASRIELRAIQEHLCPPR